MSGFRNKVAVVTGAGSGIGRALAIDLAGRGASLALSDVDTTGLAETVRQCEAMGADVRSDHLDVAERASVLSYADAVATHFGTVNLVFNNAGIAFTGDVEVSEFKDIERVIDIDFWGVVNGTKAFLPHLIASGDGHVVSISSLFGLHFFDRRLAKTAPESAASAILRGVAAGRPRVLIGADARVLDAFARLTGSGYQRVFAAVAGRVMPRRSGPAQPADARGRPCLLLPWWG